jgi:hypothetical protein
MKTKAARLCMLASFVGYLDHTLLGLQSAENLMSTSHYHKNLNDTSRSLKVKKKKILDGIELNFFSAKMQKDLLFDALIEKSYMYKSKEKSTPRHTTQPRRPNLEEKLAKTPSPRVRPMSCLGPIIVE